MRKRLTAPGPVITMAVAKRVSEGVRQAEIADELKISQGDVSRRTRAAIASKWIVVGKVEFAGDRVAPNEWKVADTLYFSGNRIRDSLLKRFPQAVGRLRRVTKVNVVDKIEPHAAIAQVIIRLLSGVASIGVTWGFTVHRLIEVLERNIGEPPRRRAPLHVVPLCGEPLRERVDPTRFSSSALAIKLARVMNGEDREQKFETIFGVPAFIPARFTDERDIRTIRQFIRTVAGYRRVFGDATASGSAAKGLADGLGAILTSVGNVSQERSGIFLKERIENGELSRADAQRILAGDIGGVLIERASASAAEKRRIDEMNRRWLGVSKGQIEACAAAAQRTGNPGVIVLALDVNRLDVVLRCIELGLVNELVVSSSLAQQFGP